MHSRLRQGLGLILTIGLASFGAACGGGAETPAASTTPADSAAPAAAPVDDAQAGELTGKIALEGTAGKNDVIKMNADPVCVRENKGAQTQEFYVVGDGGALQNVFVYVKDGLGSQTYTAPTESVKLDQAGCRYHPHVFGIMVNQPLEILNSDPTLHNIHAIPKSNQEFNTAQPIQNMKTSHMFTAKEVMVPFKCDVHGWMNAYVGVLDHPFYSVSGSDGKFDIKKLPAGTYTIEAWHEKLGTQTQSVTIGAKETKDITFTFKSAAATD